MCSFCTLPFARVIERLVGSMLEWCLVKEEIQEYSFVPYGLRFPQI